MKIQEKMQSTGTNNKRLKTSFGKWIKIGIDIKHLNNLIGQIFWIYIKDYTLTIDNISLHCWGRKLQKGNGEN